jgi:hypothetical protein
MATLLKLNGEFYLKCGPFLIRKNFLIKGVSEAMDEGAAQEVLRQFCKSLMDPVSRGKIFVQKLMMKSPNYLLCKLDHLRVFVTIPYE